MESFPKIQRQQRNPWTMTPNMRTIIADNEPLARKKLRILLGSEAGVQIVAECRDGQQTIAAVRTLKPDLLLMDIQMPDGFGVLRAIPTEELPLVITTACDQYATPAFEAHALDYLLKPVDQERLHEAIERARAELFNANDRELASRLLELVSRAQTGPQMDRRLAIRVAGRIVLLDVDEIDWVEAASNYVKLHVGRESYLLREGIGRVSEKLDSSSFVRIHRSTIANVRKIKELQPCNSGEYIVVMKDGKELSCSRGYRAELQRLIDRNP